SFVVHVVDDSHQLTGTSQHPDLPATRVAFQNNPTNASSTQDGHGFLNTHIIGGYNVGTGTANEDTSGYNYGLGIAPYARMGVTNIFGNSFATATNWESTAYTSGSRISSNSWGYISAYRYDSSAQEFDRIVRDAQTATGLQQLVVVFAAGNDGPGGNTVSSPATAKNVITVGAGENVRQTGTDGCAVTNTGANSCNDIINFSSRGPVNSTGGDGRIKPDIVAPGTHIQAGVPQSGASYTGASVCNRYWPTGQTLYGWSSGTSHSCPAVAGGAALVYQDFLNQTLPTPSPAMVKAVLMNSATRMTGTGANDTLPSNSQGMGRMDLGRALDRTPRILVDQTQVLAATGNTYQVTGTVSNSALPFRVTLAWTDAAGPTTGAPWVNNLDLSVSINGSTYLGNVFSGGASVTGGTASTRDNAESVFLPAGTTGTFTVTITGTNIAGDGVPGNGDTTDQDFALVIYNGSTTVTPPTIGVAPASLSFSATQGGANPASQTLSVTNTGGGSLAWTAASSQTWLTVSPASGTAPSTLTVTAATGALAAGTYTANITITGTGATNSPVTVPVTFTVAAPPPVLSVSPASLAFSGTAGGADPASQTVSVSNTGGGTLSWTATSNQTWLTVSPASGTAPSTLTVSASLAGLAAGSYSGTVTITSAGATGSPATVAVTLTVVDSGTPAIGVAPASLAFSATQGGANPASQTLSVTNSGTGGTLAWSASSDQSWLTVSPASGTAPSTITVTAATGSLAAGTYSANVTITGTGASNSPVVVPVTFTVAAPAPALSVSPSSLSFTGVAGGASPASQTVSISNTGGGTLSWTAASNQTWLTASPASGTAPSTLTISASTTGLAAGTYTGAVTVTAAGATGSPATVAVTLTVTSAGTQLIINGGFEGTATAWNRSGTGQVYVANGADAHGGTGYMTMGIVNSGVGTVGQQFTVPASGTLTLSYWVKVTTAETTTTTAFDTMWTEVRNTSGVLLQTVATTTNLNAATMGSYTLQTFTLTGYSGQTIRLMFRTFTNASNITTFFVDDVSLVAQ
ncbi:S8 family serine peptidase, partial [Myxococcota bacterium]|nr:S8 family serine peptidase [Myxococcota bacterium]